MLQAREKRDYCLRESKWKALKHITTDFAAHLSERFPARSYTSAREKSKIRSLEGLWRDVHKEVESMRNNNDSDLIDVKKGTVFCACLLSALHCPPFLPLRPIVTRLCSTRCSNSSRNCLTLDVR